MADSGPSTATGAGVGAGAGASSTSTTNLRAVVTGATGAIGQHIVGQLLQNDRWERVTTIGRRKLVVPTSYGVNQTDLEASGRLVQHVIDYKDLATSGNLFANHTHSFCAFGTTRKQAGSGPEFRRIDGGYAQSIATLSKAAGIPHFLYVSAEGAKPNSWFLYMQVKGEVEAALKKQQFDKLTIMQPGLLDRKDSARFGEKLASWFVSGIDVADVARAMHNISLNSETPLGVQTITGNATIKAAARAASGPE